MSKVIREPASCPHFTAVEGRVVCSLLRNLTAAHDVLSSVSSTDCKACCEYPIPSLHSDNPIVGQRAFLLGMELQKRGQAICRECFFHLKPLKSSAHSDQNKSFVEPVVDNLPELPEGIWDDPTDDEMPEFESFLTSWWSET